MDNLRRRHAAGTGAIGPPVHAYPACARIHRCAVNATSHSEQFHSRKVRALVRLINRLLP
jgi:hypothetical protein